MPATLTTVDDPRIERREFKLRSEPRGSIGFEWELASKKWLRGGFVVNRSGTPSPESDEDPTREDYMGGTIGIARGLDELVVIVTR